MAAKLKAVKVSEHSIIRARPNTPGLPSAKSLDSGMGQRGFAPIDTYTPQAPVLDPDLPDLSGFASFSKDKVLAVRDSKLESNDARVFSMDKADGKLSAIDMDWGKTGKARDLEAITAASGKQGSYLAVEGSSFGENKARLFEMSINGSSGSADKAYVLPDLGQEIEGIVSLKGQQDGHQTVLLAGRGGNGQQGRIFWGDLSQKGLSFSKEGLQGRAVEAPQVGEGQRDLSELSLDDKGNLWGLATVDNGDEGPFESSLYQVGNINPSAGAPFSVKMGESYKLRHIKAEALTMQANGTAFIGSDNETSGGRFDRVVF